MQDNAAAGSRRACAGVVALLLGGPFGPVVGAAWAQVSPGRLARAHAEMEGNLHCLDCHARGEGSMDDRCQACHQEIARYVQLGRGLHGREGREDCARCHPDHAGAEFELIAWEEGSPKAFDHRRTGWPLEGRHESVPCVDCHRAEFRRSPAADAIKKRTNRESWLGLETDCLACHEDAHRGELGSDCRSCHDLSGWRPAGRFDHASASFPLSGKHADVLCAKCHLVPGRVFLTGKTGQPEPRYKPVPHEDCANCHEDDAHHGRLGVTCGGCHDTRGFDRVNTAGFDHSKTRYPLRGRHATLPCAKCHESPRGKIQRPDHRACAACHADAHRGQATLNGRAQDCSACHDVNGFRPSTFTVTRHGDTAYPLEGRHAEVACNACHAGDPSQVARGGEAAVRMRPRHEACADCHRDVHEGQLAHRADRGACESCHRVEGWKPSTFSAERHAVLDLPLEGRHAEIPCAACHARNGGPLGAPRAEVRQQAPFAFSSLDEECATCHRDPHGGRFAEDGERPAEDGCATCHGVRSFRPSTVEVASHARFEYVLEGAHRTVPCADCHSELEPSAVRYEPTPSPAAQASLQFRARHERCADCHDTPHGDQFDARPGGGECGSCHDLAGFSPAPLFDHERDAAFALGGAHRDVACSRCHPPHPDDQGRSIVVYKPVVRDCRGCHGRAIRPASARHSPRDPQRSGGMGGPT